MNGTALSRLETRSAGTTSSPDAALAGDRREAVTRRLARWLLGDRATEFQRPVLLTAARRQSHDSAQERHDSDFLAIHGNYLRLTDLTSSIVRMRLGGPSFEWRGGGQIC